MACRHGDWPIPLRKAPRPELRRTASPVSRPACAATRIGSVFLKCWLGREDSNLRMAVPKTAALPLGDAPTRRSLLERGDARRNHSGMLPTSAKRDRRPSLHRIPHHSRSALLRQRATLAISRPPVDRSVAQSGSAPRSGRGGRRFKSCHSDHSFQALGLMGLKRPVGFRYRRNTAARATSIHSCPAACFRSPTVAATDRSMPSAFEPMVLLGRRGCRAAW